MVIVDSQWFSDCSSRRFSQVFNRSCRSHLFLVVVCSVSMVLCCFYWFSYVLSGSRRFSVFSYVLTVSQWFL